jgi:signal transduction histidine kinase
MANGLPSNISKIRRLAQKQAETITLGQLMRSRSSEPKRLIELGRWLHVHVPIRLARRLDDFLQLPYHAVQNGHWHDVYTKYVRTLDRVSSFPTIITPRDEQQFCALMQEELQAHSPVAVRISEGYREIRAIYPDTRYDYFLDNLFSTRISSRILVENYVDMRDPVEGHRGVVQRDLDPLPIIKRLAYSLKDLTTSIYGRSPDIEFCGNLSCALDYIPAHVEIIIREVLKNALRATVERHVNKAKKRVVAQDASLPPVVVELQKGDFNVIVKISDQGGGMPKKMQKEAWQYGWTSVDAGNWTDMSSRRSELAGYGFGLPLTRLYAQYFGGEVFMQALPGHGTDVYLVLNNLKEGTPPTEMDDSATALAVNENIVKKSVSTSEDV